MIRGTTPTHIFELPIAASLIKEARITYQQGDEVVFEKTEADCTFADKSISVKLTQEDTLSLKEETKLLIQLKMLTTDNEVLANAIEYVTVERVLNEEVLG